MSAPAAPAKICIHCGEDCSARPRTKDAQGRYACKGCHEKALAAAAARQKQAATVPASEPDVFDTGDDGAFAASLVSGVSIKAPETQMCESCGAAIRVDAVVCTSCGYNRQTGKQLKVSRRDPNAPEKAKGGGVGRAAAGSAAIVFSILGGAIGGLIGAVVWAAIAYATHYEVSYVAILVGALSGGGVYIIAQGYAGALTGLIAAGIAVLAVAGGKYAAFEAIVDDAGSKLSREVVGTISDNDIRQTIADSVVEEFTQKKKKMVWPDGMTPELAENPKDYPPNVWAEATKRFDAMTYEEKKARRHEMEDEIKAAVSTMVASVKEEGFTQTFDAFDILWAVLAIAAAFSVGSGAAANGGLGDD
jgi:hypothetical protein